MKMLLKGSYCSDSKTRRSKWDEKGFYFCFKMIGLLIKTANQDRVLHILERKSPHSSNCPLEIKKGYPHFLVKVNVKSSKGKDL